MGHVLGVESSAAYALTCCGFRAGERVMLSYDEVSVILRLNESGWGKKRIARELGLSVNTVKKYILAGGPLEFRKPTSKAGKADALKDWLHASFLQHRGNADVVRQELLKQHNVQLSLRQVERLVKPWRDEIAAATKATLRFETPPGKQMQLDFGQRDVLIDGRKTRVFFLIASLCYSRRVFVHSTLSERREDWLVGIEAAFAYFGGRSEELLVDNAAPLVVSHNRLTGEVVFTDEFSKFCENWRVKPKACRPQRPRTKGKVERMVSYVKGNAIAGHQFENWGAMLEHIEWWQQNIADVRELDDFDMTPKERFEEERHNLRPTDGIRSFPCIRELSRVVRSDMCVEVDTNRYSVAWRHIGKTVRVRLEGNRVGIFLGETKLAEHIRLWGRHQKTFDPSHFDGVGGHACIEMAPPRREEVSGFHRPLSIYSEALGGAQ